MLSETFPGAVSAWPGLELLPQVKLGSTCETAWALAGPVRTRPWPGGQQPPVPVTASALIVTSAPRKADGHERDHREAHAAGQLPE